MSHTESQTEFLNGKAAMIPCGTWLNSEMKEVSKPGQRMEFMLPPMPPGPGDAGNVCIGIEPFVVPSKAKNPQGGIEYFRYLTSLSKSKEFVEEKGTLMAIKGSDQAKLPAHLVKPAEAFRNSKSVWSTEYRLWYPALNKEAENAMAALLAGEITPDQFCERCETAAAAARADKNLPKHKVSR
jgi:N-acetylglucosamine transport system substrate-binding protein